MVKGTLAYTLTASQEAMLVSLLWYGLLTTEQLARRVLASTQSKWGHKLVHALHAAGFVERGIVYRRARGGSAAYYYILGNEGVRFLREHGYPELRYHPSDWLIRSPQHLEHRLRSNDVALAAERLVRHVPSLAVQELYTEYMLKLDPVVVEEGDQRATLEPDGLVVFSPTRVFAIEVDRGFESRAAWIGKLERYEQAFVQGAYQRRFRTKFLTIAVIACDGKVSKAHRAQVLRQWTREDIPQSLVAGVTLFGAMPSVPPDPVELFLRPRFLSVFGEEPEALVKGEEP